MRVRQTPDRGKELRELHREVQEAVRRAGEIVRRHWDQPRNVRHKGRIDLVTETDLAVEQALKESLRALLPEATVLAEETAGEEPLGDATWVVDPVDGTTNFAHGLPFVAVSVGLWLEDSVDLGVVYNPVLDQMFAALRGGGATMNGEPMRVSGAETLEQSLVATGFPYAIKDHLDEVVEVLRRVLEQCQGVRRYGAAALDLAHVAWGRLDGFFEATLKPWDTAAGWLLVEEAGGAVTAYDAGEPFGLYSPTVLASNGLVHRELSDILLKR